MRGSGEECFIRNMEECTIEGQQLPDPMSPPERDARHVLASCVAPSATEPWAEPLSGQEQPAVSPPLLSGQATGIGSRASSAMCSGALKSRHPLAPELSPCASAAGAPTGCCSRDSSLGSDALLQSALLSNGSSLCSSASALSWSTARGHVRHSSISNDVGGFSPSGCAALGTPYPGQENGTGTNSTASASGSFGFPKSRSITGPGELRGRAPPLCQLELGPECTLGISPISDRPQPPVSSSQTPEEKKHAPIPRCRVQAALASAHCHTPLMRSRGLMPGASQPPTGDRMGLAAKKELKAFEWAAAVRRREGVLGKPADR